MTGGLCSMTGFGAAASDGPDGALRAEARSVNHRFLQLKLRLPDELAELEPRVEALARARLDRGAVTLTLELERGAPASAANFDAALARRYAEEARRVGRELGIGGELSLEALLALPGVVSAARPRDLGGADAALAARALATVEVALERLLEMRRAEGRALAADLEARAGELAATAAQLGARMPDAVRAQHDALRKRVAELLGERAALAPADLARELALLADRADVSEELARVESHLAQLGRILRAGAEKRQAVGRQLDFLVQELLREFNTAGSKCGDAAAAALVIEAKATLERLREQVQNVE
jgi:uncharacterized protein (TIGR00255 family)